jgi:hypothetical protein
MFIIVGYFKYYRTLDGAGNNHVAGQKFPNEKGSVRQCVVVMPQPVVLLQKFRARSSHIFTQSP